MCILRHCHSQAFTHSGIAHSGTHTLRHCTLRHSHSQAFTHLDVHPQTFAYSGICTLRLAHSGIPTLRCAHSGICILRHSHTQTCTQAQLQVRVWNAPSPPSSPHKVCRPAPSPSVLTGVLVAARVQSEGPLEDLKANTPSSPSSEKF